MQWTCIIRIIKTYYITVVIILLMVRAKNNRVKEHGVEMYNCCIIHLIELHGRVDGEM